MMQQPTLKKPRWVIPRPADQEYHMVVNRWLNGRPKFVVAFHIEADGTRSPHEMHLADAERVIREFPREWSKFPSAADEPLPTDKPTVLDQIGAIESELKSLEAHLTATRREITGTGRRN